MSPLRRLFACLVMSVCSCIALADPRVTATEIIGPFTGHDAPLDPANETPQRIEYYGTDLGFSYAHQGEIRFLFGDTWANEAYAPIQASTAGRFDDGFGSIVAKSVVPVRIAPGHVPKIRLGQNTGTQEMSAIDPGHVMDLGKTPMGGFSSGTREFGLFNTTKPQGCRADGECGAGLSCDTGLGSLGTRFDDEAGLTLPCVDGSPGCASDPRRDPGGAAISGSGLCVDRSSSVWSDTPGGRTSAVALQQRVGLRSLEDPRRYTDVRRWLTNKFVNTALRTVDDFDPARASQANYSSGVRGGSHPRVFLWGRPGFIGVAARQRTLGLYFAYADLPKGPGFAWTLNYYVGMGDGGPRFSTQEADAVPLDLDSGVAGAQTAETHDVVNQMSVAWIPALQRWVMFYGGGMTKLPSPPLPNCGVLELFTGRDCTAVVTGNGAVRLRTAHAPWGPWSAPVDVLAGGDPAVAGSGLYRPGGMLRHPACTAPGCATPTRSAAYHAEEYGFLYGANLIEEWTSRRGAGVDVYWNASTWDPYRVALFRTHIEP